MNTLKLVREAKIWVFDGIVILTDPEDSKRHDAVFPVCAENAILCRNLAVKDGSVVLDLCSGSGIVALFAAQKAEKVIAVDTNPRAIEFARFNADLNQLKDKVEVRLGDLLEPVSEMKFDLITANPPFEPIPEGLKYYLHSNGGPDGMSIAEQICMDVADYLADDGVFQMVLFSPKPEQQQWHKYIGESLKRVELRQWESKVTNGFRRQIIRKLSLFNPRFQEELIETALGISPWLVTAWK